MIGQLRGRFGNTGGTPYLEAFIRLPRLGVEGAISLVFDTGCDQSLLMPIDGIRLGVDYSALQGGVSSLSAGGEMEHFNERALFVFTQPGKKVFGYEIEIAIAKPTPEIEEIPSLLGRDIIRRWRSVIKPSTGYLACDVLSADLAKSIPRK